MTEASTASADRNRWCRCLRALALICCAAAAGACTNHDAAGGVDASTTEGGFAQEIFPLLQTAGCNECHQPGSIAPGHWTLTTAAETYAQWLNSSGFDHCDPDGGGITAPAPIPIRVVPGDPDGSLVIKKLTDPWEMCGVFFGQDAVRRACTILVHVPEPLAPWERFDARESSDS